MGLTSASPEIRSRSTPRRKRIDGDPSTGLRSVSVRGAESPGMPRFLDGPATSVVSAMPGTGMVTDPLAMDRTTRSPVLETSPERSDDTGCGLVSSCSEETASGDDDTTRAGGAEPSSRLSSGTPPERADETAGVLEESDGMLPSAETPSGADSAAGFDGDDGLPAALMSEAGPAPDEGHAGPAADDALHALDTGSVALIDTELAEHLRWGAAGARVGSAGSADRADFVARSAGAGAAGGFLHAGAMGLAVGAGTRVAEIAAARGAGALAARSLTRLYGPAVARLAGPALARSAPLPAIGAVVGGVFSAIDLATRDWSRTGETIGRFGEGGSIYEQLANSIAAVSEIIGIATAVLNVIAGVIGAISIAMWVITVLTVGVASPLALTLSTIAGAIGIATMILDAINALVLQRLVTLFRALHTFTSQADPSDVEAQGGRIGEAAGASAGFVGGMAGGLAGGFGVGRGARRLGIPEHPTLPDVEPPRPAGGDGPTITADPPPLTAEGLPSHDVLPAGDRPALLPPEPVVPLGAPDAPLPMAEGPGPVDPHAPTLPAADPHAATIPAADPHAPTELPVGPDGMPDIPPPPRLPDIGPLPDYGPELPNWNPDAPSPYRPTEPAGPLHPSTPPVDPTAPTMIDPVGPTHPAPVDPVASTGPAPSRGEGLRGPRRIADGGAPGHGLSANDPSPNQARAEPVSPVGSDSAPSAGTPDSAQASFPGFDEPAPREPRSLSPDEVAPPDARSAWLRSERARAAGVDPPGPSRRANNVARHLVPGESSFNTPDPRPDLYQYTPRRAGHQSHHVESQTALAESIANYDPALDPTVMMRVAEHRATFGAQTQQRADPNFAADLGTSGALEQAYNIARFGLVDAPPPGSNPRRLMSDEVAGQVVSEHAGYLFETGATSRDAAPQGRPVVGEDARVRSGGGVEPFESLDWDRTFNQPDPHVMSQPPGTQLGLYGEHTRPTPPVPEQLTLLLPDPPDPRQGTLPFDGSLAESRFRSVAEPTRGPTRSTRPLTPAEFEAHAALLSEQFGVPRDRIHPGEFTAFHPGETPQDGFITIGPDVNPLPAAERPTGGPNPANAALEPRAVLAHESLGHRDAELAGQVRDADWHEEFQASTRAALLDPGLTPEQRWALMRDAEARRRFAPDDDTIYVWTDPLTRAETPASADLPVPHVPAADALPSVMIDPALLGQDASARSGPPASGPRTAVDTAPALPEFTPAEVDAAMDRLAAGPLLRAPADDMRLRLPAAQGHAYWGVDPVSGMTVQEWNVPAERGLAPRDATGAVVPGPRGEVRTQVRLHSPDAAATPGSASARDWTMNIVQGHARMRPDGRWFDTRFAELPDGSRVDVRPYRRDATGQWVEGGSGTAVADARTLAALGQWDADMGASHILLFPPPAPVRSGGPPSGTGTPRAIADTPGSSAGRAQQHEAAGVQPRPVPPRLLARPPVAERPEDETRSGATATGPADAGPAKGRPAPRSEGTSRSGEGRSLAREAAGVVLDQQAPGLRAVYRAWFDGGTRESRTARGGGVGGVVGGTVGGVAGAYVGRAVGEGVARRAEDFHAGLERGSEPVVEPVNPAYPAPPGTGSRQELVDLQNQLLAILDARARTEQLERLMCSDAEHHEANAAPLSEFSTRTEEAISATEAHRQAVALREAANQNQRGEEANVAQAITDYGQRAAGLAVIKTPLEGFTAFTYLGHALPDDPGVLRGAKRGILQMNTDGQNFLNALNGIDAAVANQAGSQPDREAAIGERSGRLDSTAGEAEGSRDALSTARDDGQGLVSSNTSRVADSRQREGVAAQHGQRLDGEADRTRGEITDLSARWQAWAQAHRQARRDAMDQTRAAMVARGWRPRDASEGGAQ